MKTSLSYIALSAASVLILSAAAHAQIKKVGSGYTFKMKFVKGRTYTYEMLTKANGIELTGPMVMTVLSSSGSTAKIRIVNGPLYSKGEKVSDKREITVTENSSGGITGGGQQIAITLPSKPVKVGGSWDGSTVLGIGSNASQVKAHYKLEAVKNFKGHKLAQIHVDLSSTGAAKAVGSGTIALSTEDCSLYSTSTNLKYSTTGVSGTLSMQVVRK